jgi:hypothetical protein
VKLATRHGLAALAHRNLTRAGAPMTKAASAALWARSEWAARRGQAMAAELERISSALLESRTRFVSFKGPLLAERLHGEAGLRESGDLDFLVSPRDVPAARRTLETLGYSPLSPLDAQRERLWLDSPQRHEMVFSNPGNAMLVELQWRANPGLDLPAIDDASWWERAPVFEWRGLPMTAVPPDEELLALLVHGTKHFWGSLDWLVDIAEISRRCDAPWPGLLRLAREHRAVRRAALGLDLAHRLLDAPCPELARQLIDEAAIQPVTREVTPALLDPSYRPYGIGKALRLQLALCDDRPQRAAMLAASARPTPGDWEWVRLPAGFSWLYWLLRPLRLAAKYLTRSPRTPPAATPRTRPPRPRSTG